MLAYVFGSAEMAPDAAKREKSIYQLYVFHHDCAASKDTAPRLPPRCRSRCDEKAHHVKKKA